MISARSQRTFFTALVLAELPAPRSFEEIGERFLDLLVLGVDHSLVGSGTWLTRIVGGAFDHADEPDTLDDDERDA